MYKTQGNLDDLDKNWWHLGDKEEELVSRINTELTEKAINPSVLHQLEKIPKAQPNQCPKCRNFKKDCVCYE